jgi:DNA polymerase I
MPKPLVLVDGSSYFFRAFHALPPLTNSKGQPTGAVYGVANMIKRLIKDYDPEHMTVVFDAKGKTFRDEWYPEYKANRPPMPEELSSQFKPLLEVLEAMGFPLLTISGVEADDVIGTLAHQATEAEVPVIISTGDKDMAQLVNQHVTLINTMSNKLLDPQGVSEKFGVRPNQIIDYLTLVGDTSDNIPGVPKCGPKTASKWLQEYETLDNLVAHADDIGGKIGERLRESLELIPLSKKLVTIKTDLDLPLNIHELNRRPIDKPKLIELTKHLEFKTWLKELLDGEDSNEKESAPTIQKEVAYKLITKTEELDALVQQLTSCDLFSVDTETTSLNAMQANIVGISIATHGKEPIYIPLKHDDESTQLDREDVLSKLKPILEDTSRKKVGQNLKYDYNVFKNHGVTLQGICCDTMLESYVLNSTAGRHDMDSLALKYLGYKTISFEEVAGKGSKQVTFDKVPVQTAAPYAAEDADITLRLHDTLYPMMSDSLKKVFHDIEMPLLTVLADMERTGVLIDKDTLYKQGERLKKELLTLEEEAYAITGKPFNLSSPKQLQEILFVEHQLPIISKTPKGQPSTAEAVLQELAYDYRLPAVILRHRSLSKLVSTYIDALPKRINPETNRVHTSYNQAVTATGRLSSSEPNLQNIPIRSEEGRMIRKAFIAPKGHVLLAADYSQIELRIMAHLSQDKGLLTAFEKGWDIHAATASEIFDVPLDDVTSDQRRRAKAVNFGLIYGMSAYGLSKQIDVERNEAQAYIDKYFHRYPGVLSYMEETRASAHEKGYVETVFGRRLHLPEINARNIMRQKAAERTAINAPMQGTAADIIKKAMIATSEWQQSHDAGARMVMQVHDELVFEIQEQSLDSAKTKIKELMECTVSLSVPIEVSIGIGANWDEAH